MRIKPEQIVTLKKSIQSRLPDASVYLFGSRTDDCKKGGDIDILVLSSNRLTLIQKSKIRSEYYKKFGEQKIDLISFTYQEEDNFKELVMLEAIKI